MESFVRVWLFDPTVARIVAAVAALIAVYGIVGVINRTMGRYVEDNDTRF
jgi:hypothetical protein